MNLSLKKMLYTVHHNTTKAENGPIKMAKQPIKANEAADYITICQYSKRLFKSDKNDFQRLV